MMPGLTVVVSPLISLMKDQVDNLRKKGIQSGGFINSTQTTKERQHEVKRILNQETKILYVSPERLASRSFLELLASVKIGLLIIDEAHCISQWGHDFRPDYLTISYAKKKIHPKSSWHVHSNSNRRSEARHYHTNRTIRRRRNERYKKV